MENRLIFSVIGLSQNDFSQFNHYFHDSPLKDRFQLRSIDYCEEKLIDSLFDTDLLLINPFVFEKGPLETFLNIRQNYPSTQLAIIGYGTHYGILLSALRGGIQDIIHFPWDKDEVLSVVEGLINRFYLQQKDLKLSRMLELVSFFGQGKKISSTYGLFHQVKSFLKQQFATETLFVLQLCEDQIKKIYDENSPDKDFVCKEVCSFFSGVEGKNRYNFDYMEININKKDYFITNLGDFEENQFLSIIDLESPILKDWKIEVIMHFSRIFRELFQRTAREEKSDELSLLIYLDDLTGLYNQRRLKKDLDHLELNYKEKKEIFSALFIDLDYFKKVNDQYGHLIGSMLLVEVSKEMKKVVRETDYIYRYGGDEFIVLIPNVDGETAKNIALRILDVLKKKRFSNVFHDLIKNPFSLSVSIGIAEYPKDADTKDKIIVMADNMMYEAKKKGRGTICHVERVLSSEKSGE